EECAAAAAVAEQVPLDAVNVLVRDQPLVEDVVPVVGAGVAVVAQAAEVDVAADGVVGVIDVGLLGVGIDAPVGHRHSPVAAAEHAAGGDVDAAAELAVGVAGLHHGEVGVGVVGEVGAAARRRAENQ